MGRAVVTLAVNFDLIRFSRPFFRCYADRVDADYVEIVESKVNHPFCPMMEKLQLFDLLGIYDRVVYFDADCLVRPDTPDLFELVPFDMVGAVFDCPDNFERNTNMNNHIFAIKRVLGYINWSCGYINSGVLVVSSCHRDIFRFDSRLLGVRDRFFLEQNFINYNIRRCGFSIFKLPRVFNGIGWGGEKGFYEKGELVYVLHFAGFPNKIVLMEKYFNVLVSLYPGIVRYIV